MRNGNVALQLIIETEFFSQLLMSLFVNPSRLDGGRQGALVARLGSPSRARYLGDVQAPDERAAEAAEAIEFELSDDQRKRVVVQGRD